MVFRGFADQSTTFMGHFIVCLVHFFAIVKSDPDGNGDRLDARSLDRDGRAVNCRQLIQQ